MALKHDLMIRPEDEHWAGTKSLICKRCGKTRLRHDAAGWPSSYSWFTQAGNEIKLQRYEDPPCVERD